MANRIVFTKQHGDTEDFSVNYADRTGLNDGSQYDMGYLQGRTIESLSVTGESGLTVDNFLIDQGKKRVTVWVSGGTSGNVYDVTITITTNLNNVRVDNVKVVVT